MNDICFKYVDQRFADIQMLRYRLKGFEKLTLQQKKYIYCLSEATLIGRDIIFDQNGKYNLRIRRLFEYIYRNYSGDRDCENFQKLIEYLKRIWFSNGIYHHYSCDKFIPDFSEGYLKNILLDIVKNGRINIKNETFESIIEELFPVIFNPKVLPKRVNLAVHQDLVLTSACNFYEGVSQKEVDDFYENKKKSFKSDLGIYGDINSVKGQPSWGLNSKVVKKNGQVKELVYKVGGLYGEAIEKIVFWLDKAKLEAENDEQRKIIEKLIKFYNTGDLSDFDDYSIDWTLSKCGKIDFVNGFIEVYGDPMGLKGTWEGVVEFIDEESTKRTHIISSQAQWFEDNSPIDNRFKKKKVKGISANVICAAMLGGEEYPASAIGINLPNADWIRAVYGSKSVTIGNLTEAYNEAAKGNGFIEEFVDDYETLSMIKQFDNICDSLHTDLHECLGHGSGQLLPGVNSDALGAYGSTIEEARADLFGLYFMADEKLIELGVLDNREAYKAHYYTYMLNGLMTQLIRIKPNQQIEESHMRNRALIAYWVYENSCGAVELRKKNDKTYLYINDYNKLRSLFAELLKEIQRIKSEGDYSAARSLVEKYGVKVDADLHDEVLKRYEKLNLAPYKGFINPRFSVVRDENGNVIDIDVDYSEGYEEQMFRYSDDYSTL